MQVQYVAAYRSWGISKKTGKPYDFYQVEYLTPIQKVETEKYNKVGYGSQISSIGLLSSMLDEFKDIKPAAMVELDIRPNPTNPRENICFGVKA